MKGLKTLILLSFLISLYACNGQAQKHRVLVSTDIGGSDPDDFQSLIHLFLYADTLDIVGLVSSPPYKGRKSDILKMIDIYEKDFSLLGQNYPTPAYLRSITAQGATEAQLEVIPSSESNEGVQLIIKEALKENERPLYVLVWGSITDLALALHQAPEIKRNMRVYSIGSWNTFQDSLARNYIYDNHPDLWWVENNTTFRGMYMGGYKDGNYGNESFVEANVKPYGAMGEFFFAQKADIKMGDTPSVLYLLNGDPANPESESWGGQFQKTSHGSNYWTDIQDESLKVNGRSGAKTVNKWRKQYLDDWSKRMKLLE
ncbi:Inosine-uridine preferring nucleoside hydrolase [Spirosomataceae bacterium TFI 002]|nr:Inosine-uridine preferring nucleoside hydrolase [Spirosomataceae bacterium TFI 002]